MYDNYRSIKQVHKLESLTEIVFIIANILPFNRELTPTFSDDIVVNYTLTLFCTCQLSMKS